MTDRLAELEAELEAAEAADLLASEALDHIESSDTEGWKAAAAAADLAATRFANASEAFSREKRLLRAEELIISALKEGLSAGEPEKLRALAEALDTEAEALAWTARCVGR